MKQQAPAQDSPAAAGQEYAKGREKSSLELHRERLHNLLASDSTLAATLGPIFASYERRILKQQKQIKALKREIQQRRSREADHLKLEELLQENARLQKALQEHKDSESAANQQLKSTLQSEQAKNLQLLAMLDTLEALGISVKQVCANSKSPPRQASSRISPERPAIVPKLPIYKLN